MVTHVHNDLDTLPRVSPTRPDGTVDVHLPLWLAPGAGDVAVRLVARWADQGVVLTGMRSPHGVVCEIPLADEPEDSEGRRRACTPAERPYVVMRARMRDHGGRCFEAQLHGVPAGAEVDYDFVVLAPGDPEPEIPAPDSLARRLYASNPEWVYEDIIRMYCAPGLLGAYSCVVYHQEADGLHHVRVDVADICTHLKDLRIGIEVGGRTTEWHFTEPSKVRRPVVLIDRSNDYLVASLPADAPIGLLTVTIAAEQGHETIEIPDVAEAHRDPGYVGTANLLLVHFCIQALNDLFDEPYRGEEPFRAYDPPRTYMQITMRDELGGHSSRPLSPENRVADGYALTLDAHRHYRVPHLWTFNAGLLAMLAHDCPEQFAALQTDVAEGLVDPTVVGFAGHRPTYYQPETNRYTIEFGRRMMETYLGRANSVFFPDSRFYRAATDLAPVQETGMRFLVVDAATTLQQGERWDTTDPQPRPYQDHDGRYLDHQYLWRDRESGLYLLMIETELREGMFGHSEEEFTQGKLPQRLRDKFLGFATTSVRRDNLMVYGDDADKASGNGWFDGLYDGTGKQYNDMWTASLEWIAAHPWIRVVTSRDLEGSPEAPPPGRDKIRAVGEFDLDVAIDPSVDPGGLLTTDTAGGVIHFDTWYDRWKDYRATWLNQSLEEISQEAEFAVLDWPQPYRDRTRLYELAQMSFAGSTHELPWNKQPLEKDPNTTEVLDPEDFVVAASLQVRNLHVYLAATVWAQWAVEGGAGAYCNDGPVAEILPSLRYAADNPMPHLRGKPLQDSPVHWDHDLLANVILYNPEALVVFDRNGGRITHLFSMVDGEPLCVSGTFKCYQYSSPNDRDERRLDRTCDGPVLQNTVFTPNHAYVATDVLQSRALAAEIHDSRLAESGRSRATRPWWYPDNFNVYEDGRIGGDGGRSVQFRYRGRKPHPSFLDMANLTGYLEQDRRARQGSGEPAICWGDPTLEFGKTVTLDGRTLTVSYTGARAGHLVANEFCVDLWAGMLEGAQLRRRITADAGFVTLGTHTVAVTPGPGCGFSDDTTATDEQGDFVRGRRVLTDRLDIVCPDGGDFSYTITLP